MGFQVSQPWDRGCRHSVVSVASSVLVFFFPASASKHFIQSVHVVYQLLWLVIWLLPFYISINPLGMWRRVMTRNFRSLMMRVWCAYNFHENEWDASTLVPYYAWLIWTMADKMRCQVDMLYQTNATRGHEWMTVVESLKLWNKKFVLINVLSVSINSRFLNFFFL